MSESLARLRYASLLDGIITFSQAASYDLGIDGLRCLIAAKSESSQRKILRTATGCSSDKNRRIAPKSTGTLMVSVPPVLIRGACHVIEIGFTAGSCSLYAYWRDVQRYRPSFAKANYSLTELDGFCPKWTASIEKLNEYAEKNWGDDLIWDKSGSITVADIDDPNTVYAWRKFAFGTKHDLFTYRQLQDSIPPHLAVEGEFGLPVAERPCEVVELMAVPRKTFTIFCAGCGFSLGGQRLSQDAACRICGRKIETDLNEVDISRYDEPYTFPCPVRVYEKLPSLRRRMASSPLGVSKYFAAKWAEPVIQLATRIEPNRRIIDLE